MKPPFADPASYDRLVHEVTHDFNNLLTAIIAATDAIMERTDIDPETRADIDHVREGARRGAALVRRLRPDTGEQRAPELISINQTIRATSRLLAHRLGPDIALALELTEPDGLVLAEPSQLDRAVLNLITNARHAMPKGGTVTLRTERRTLLAAETHVPDVIPAGDYVVIRVIDTGTGIPRDQLVKFFEPGVSGRRGGSGLGLSSVREIVLGCNGFIAVTSDVAIGTCFEIYLPRHEGEVGSAHVAEPSGKANARTVLLVEDDPLVRQVAERILHRAGWSVVCADTAEGALAVMEGTRCDLMISDVAMRGMDGIALARLVLARQPDFPVILTSGYESEVEFATGRVAFLAKPYGRADLLDAVVRIAPDEN